MRKILRMLLTCSTLFLTSISFAESFTCQVVNVINGNTIRCLNEQKRNIKVKLAHIEAPKINQPFGLWAKQDLFRTTFKKYITVEFDSIEVFYRTSEAVIYVGCKDVNQDMIKNGMAWVAYKDVKKPLYIQAEKEARQNKRGLWYEKTPIPPWDWKEIRY